MAGRGAGLGRSQPFESKYTRDALKRHSQRSPGKGRKRAALGNITNVKPARVIVNKVKIPDDPKKPTYKEDHSTTVTVVTDGRDKGEVDSDYYIISSSQESDSDSSKTSSQQSQSNRSRVDAENEKNIKVSQQARHKGEEWQLPEGVVDIDKDIYVNIENVPEYAKDIFAYLRKREKEFVTSTASVLDVVPAKVWKKRENIIKWFTQVQEEFSINHETMYHGVKLFDLYLLHTMPHAVPDKTAEFAVLAGAAFFLASKLDDQLAPGLDSFVEALENMCDKTQIIQAEMKIVQALHFNLSIPHGYEFLRRFGKCIQLDMPSITLARYILETVNMDHTFLPLLDSRRAAAALYLALKMIDYGSWTPQLQYYSGYDADELIPIAKQMNQSLSRYCARTDLNPILMKYRHQVFFKVADIPLITDKAICEPE